MRYLVKIEITCIANIVQILVVPLQFLGGTISQINSVSSMKISTNCKSSILECIILQGETIKLIHFYTIYKDRILVVIFLVQELWDKMTFGIFFRIDMMCILWLYFISNRHISMKVIHKRTFWYVLIFKH